MEETPTIDDHDVLHSTYSRKETTAIYDDPFDKLAHANSDHWAAEDGTVSRPQSSVNVIKLAMLNSQKPHSTYVSNELQYQEKNLRGICGTRKSRTITQVMHTMQRSR